MYIFLTFIITLTKCISPWYTRTGWLGVNIKLLTPAPLHPLKKKKKKSLLDSVNSKTTHPVMRRLLHLPALDLFWRDLGSIPPRLSFLFERVVFCGHRLVTLSLTINETLKYLSSLPSLMQESFWWRQCNDRYIIALFPHLHTPCLLPAPNKPDGLCGR